MVAQVHEYKRFENSLVRRMKRSVVNIGKGFAGFFQAIGHAFTKRYTIVFVPHTEKKVYNFHISVLSICCFCLVLAGVVGVCFWCGASYSSANGALVAKDTRLKNTQASLDELRDEVADLLKAARNFQPALSSTLAALGADAPGADNSNTADAGDLSSFFDVRETPNGYLQEAQDVKKLAKYLASAAQPVKEIGGLLDQQSALLTEIPSIWPVRGGIGHISMYFGQNVNPFSGMYYIHKGIDISTYRQGDPIVATADGQVVSVEYDPDSFGNNVIIKHKHGFFTRYGHMLSVKAKIGQKVQQGQVIGYIGNTGLTTGAHLHYEVHIGSDVVDPYKYITMRQSIAKSSKQ